MSLLNDLFDSFSSHMWSSEDGIDSQRDFYQSLPERCMGGNS